MVDLGSKKDDGNSKDYETKFLSELKPGDEIEGEIHIGDIKKRKIKNKDVNEFFVILTDQNNKKKWICGFVTSYYPEKGNIYGEKEGKVYTLIDSLNHLLNNSPRNTEESYSLIFDVFKENINENVKKVKVKAVQSWKPGAKSVNLEVLEAELESKEDEASKIESIAVANDAVKIAYESLKTRGKDINKKSVAFELRSVLDKDKITRSQFKEALHELDKL
ncbi:MAG: hypothetical protein ACXVHV_03440 [Methanobacterium sp.]